jgi:hypothetical protein
MAGPLVIVTHCVAIGLLAAAGFIVITQRVFAPKAEQIFCGLFLIPIAGFYLRSSYSDGVRLHQMGRAKAYPIMR